MDYSELIRRKFPHDEERGFYRRPNIPSNAKAKVLNDYTKVNQTEIEGIYRFGSLLGPSGSIVLTPTKCFYPKGSFILEDLKSITTQEKEVQFQVNIGGGSLSTIKFKCKNPEDAALLANFMDTLAYAPKADEVVEKVSYEGFSTTSLDWLELRDEVMKTIDMLSDRFQDGRLTLLEFEEKKAELLSRL